MFERFTDRARRVLVYAQEEARLLGHNFVGTEHLLLGLLRTEEGVAAQVLESLGVHVAEVREKVAETVSPVEGEATGSPPFTPRAKKVLELSLREALQLGHNYIGTEHLLLGIVREGEGMAARVLKEIGAPLERVRDQVKALVNPPGPAQAGATLPLGSSPRGPRGDPPYCPRCGAGLAESARYRGVQVAPCEAGGADMGAVFIYCSVCGVALSHSLPS